MPIAGAHGDAWQVARADDLPGEVKVRLQWAIYPPPVAFIDDEKFEFDISKTIETEAGDEEKTVTRSARWSAERDDE